MSSEHVRRRLVEVDRVTGLAIFLVVVGHVVARDPPAGAHWYVTLKIGIYLFHMPLFMFLSGVVFQHTRIPIETPGDYRRWAFKKIARLAPGFFLIGTLIALGKTLARSFVHVDNLRGDALQGFVGILIRPTESAAASLWYIYVLLELYLLFPLLVAICGGRRIPVTLVTLALHLVHWFGQPTRYLAVHALCEYALFFWLGALCCERYDELLRVVRRAGLALLAVFAASFVTLQLFAYQITTTAVGLASIPAAFWLVGLNTGRLGAACAYLSAYTFVIYLLNTIAIGITKGVLLKLMPWDGANFYLFFVVLLTAGIAGPIIAYRWVFSRNARVARIMN